MPLAVASLTVLAALLMVSLADSTRVLWVMGEVEKRRVWRRMELRSMVGGWFGLCLSVEDGRMVKY